MAGRGTRSQKSRPKRKLKGKKAPQRRKKQSTPCYEVRLRSSSIDSAVAQQRIRLNATTLSDTSRPSTSSSTSSGRKRRSTTTEADGIVQCPSVKRQPRLNLLDNENDSVMSDRDRALGDDQENVQRDRVPFRSIPEEEEGNSDDSFDYDTPSIESSSDVDDEEDGVFSDNDDSEVNSELENPEFVRIEAELNDENFMTAAAPPQLTEISCRGVGTPSEVWNLLCRKDEVVRPDQFILQGAVEITEHVRAVLIDWMMEVCENEKQHRETFHLAIDYVDRFLASDKLLSVDSFQCIGTTALFIASKYEEIYPPRLDQLVEYTDFACTDEQVRNTEIVMLSKLSWSLATVTSIHWLNIYLQLLGTKDMREQRHTSDQPCIVPKYLREDYLNMAKVLDLVMLDVGSLKYSYRELAAAVLFECYEPHSLVQQVTGYSYEQLLPVVEWVEPCVRVSEKTRSAGDPLPYFEDVRPEEWHNIQTHFQSSHTNVKELRDAINEERLMKKKRIKETKSRASNLRSRTFPLRSRHNGSSAIH